MWTTLSVITSAVSFSFVLLGLIAGVSFWLFGLPYPLILVAIGITNVIPYFGPFIGAVPSLLLSLAISAKAVIIVIVTIFILQFIEGNILSPLIVGRSLRMHPVVIMLALLAGGELAGIPGMILAVPAAAVLKVTIHFCGSGRNIDIRVLLVYNFE